VRIEFSNYFDLDQFFIFFQVRIYNEVVETVMHVYIRYRPTNVPIFH